MAVVDVIENSSSQQFGISSDGRSAQRGFTVKFDTSTSATSFKATWADGVPRYGEVHNETAFLWVRSINARPIGGAGSVLYQVDVIYGTASSPDDEDDPLLRASKYAWSLVNAEQQIDLDINGKAIATLFAEPFDPPIMAQRSDLSLTISKNFAGFDAIGVADYASTVNNAPFEGFPAGSVFMESVTATQETEGTFRYWRVGAAFVIRYHPLSPTYDAATAWHLRVRAEGFYVADGAGGNRRAVEIITGEAKVSPVLHNITSGVEITDPALAEWYLFQVYPARDFSALGF